MDALEQDTMEALAANGANMLLWALTGRRWGVFETTGEKYRVVTCQSALWPTTGTRRTLEPGIGGGVCHGGCCRLELARRPVIEVLAVSQFSEPLEDWTLNGSQLTLLGGECRGCSACGDDTITVDYRHGIPWPPFAAAALGELQSEFIAGMSGNGVCRLSSRAVSVSRQGVTVDMQALSSEYAEGRTGLPLTDALITTVNPNGLKQRPRIVSPDHATRVG
jgi:hypothetical protein